MPTPSRIWPLAKDESKTSAVFKKPKESETVRIVYRAPMGKDGLFVQPKTEDTNKARAEREMVERLNRLNFVAHFHYEDPWTPRVGAVTWDEEGDYNCGRCNKLDGKDRCLIIPIRVHPEAGSCKHWEIQCASDREMDVSQIGHTAEAAVYGVSAAAIAAIKAGKSAKGLVFGCHNCPFASKAFAPDSVGRNMYCGKGDFRVPWNACCELNGAKVVSDYEGNKPVAEDKDY